MKGSLLTVWRWVRWPLLVVVVGYVALVAVRVVMIFDEEKTAAAVAEIHAQRLTLADVNGDNLPPIPDQVENDATVEGIDKNNNGIRDDVEHAIFKKYPDDKKARAAALQYAMELQMEFTRVFNSETLVATIQEKSRGFLCIEKETDAEQIEMLVRNTQKRIEFRETLYDKYMTSYALPNFDYCDLEIS